MQPFFFLPLIPSPQLSLPPSLSLEQDEFWKRIAQWMLLGVPACMTNSMIKYMEIKIACLFRERLTKEAVKQYMSGNTFYSVSNLDGRLGNADQCLTEDIAKFSQHLSHLYADSPFKQPLQP